MPADEIGIKTQIVIAVWIPFLTLPTSVRMAESFRKGFTFSALAALCFTGAHRNMKSHSANLESTSDTSTSTTPSS